MKRKGLSWDGGKKRIVAAAMMLSVLAAPGVAHAAPISANSDAGTVSVTTDFGSVKVNARAFGVSWS